MHRPFIAFSLLLLFLSVSASCSGEASIAVPAVVGDDGNLVGLSVKLIAGPGDIYLTAEPNTGTSTQASIEDSVLFAFSKNNRSINGCDVLIKIDGKGIASYVDGPSAGAAVSVMTYSALTGLPIRSDAILTGGATVYGGIIRVGGLFEKTMAAATSGKQYLVAPLNSISEKIILRPLKEKYNISVIEIKDVNEAIDFMIYMKDLPTNEITALMRPLPDVTPYNVSSKLEGFRRISWSMLETENYSITLLPAFSNESIEIKHYFENELQRQYHIHSMGYYFTAANEAFLNYIDIGTMNAVDNLDLDAKISDINTCLNSMKPRQKTRDDFEYLIGSELRQEWAIQKVREVSSDPAELVEEKYFSYNELMYADAWCRIAQKLDATKPGGPAINESLWKDMAAEQLQKASEASASGDLADRLLNAKSLYDKGEYGASLFDSLYVVSMHDADSISDIEMQNLRIAELSNQTRTSLWGQIYQSQGIFMLQTENDPRSILRILYFADAIETMTNKMEDVALADGKQQEDFALDLLGIGVAVSFVLFSVGLYLMVMGRNRPGSKTARPRKTGWKTRRKSG